MKYYILTLGCQMNLSDSERIKTKLEEMGYKSAGESSADLVIVNACSVRQHAVDRIWGMVKKWSIDGRQVSKTILITGCVVQSDIKKLKNKNIIFFNIKDLPNLPRILENHYQFSKKLIMKSDEIKKENDLSYFKILSFNKPKKKNDIAYIPIMTGCDNFCSYCAVPYTRGREVSRPMEEITAEVQRAVNNGYREILLLGQNVNSYGINQNSKIKKQNDKSKGKNVNTNFIQLLKTIDNSPGNFTFNFMSSNPHDMGDELISCFASLKKWPRELHLAMQSGDDGILRQMNRKYTSSQFLAKITKLKDQISKINISTDIIVGFPGETDDQFLHTYEVCKKVGFEKAYISQYSSRPGTLAAKKFPDDISPAVKKDRWLKLNNLINR